MLCPSMYDRTHQHAQCKLCVLTTGRVSVRAGRNGRVQRILTHPSHPKFKFAWHILCRDICRPRDPMCWSSCNRLHTMNGDEAQHRGGRQTIGGVFS